MTILVDFEANWAVLKFGWTVRCQLILANWCWLTGHEEKLDFTISMSPNYSQQWQIQPDRSLIGSNTHSTGVMNHFEALWSVGYHLYHFTTHPRNFETPGFQTIGKLHWQGLNLSGGFYFDFELWNLWSVVVRWGFNLCSIASSLVWARVFQFETWDL